MQKMLRSVKIGQYLDDSVDTVPTLCYRVFDLGLGAEPAGCRLKLDTS